ncbi:sucrose responsive element binding protein [Hibiscus syriacus]|uniref:Sucrose responsive element binding protein n=1 Tax=Hibiscus syriacus TaxID=106335 RepID=A0A6A3CV18_HIBSY|nr:protein BIC1-like [Hibiscus syriacus]KAE8731108.1 sucrose responsive element binding protein [Hibiscus syriacus]
MNVEAPPQMTTHPPNPPQFLEEPSKSLQADEGSSLKGQCSSADGVRQVVVDEVAIGAVRRAEEDDDEEEDNGRERLKRHRIEVAKSRVWIPDIWGQEDLLKDWIDCSAFDECLVPTGITSARAALVEQGTRSTTRRIRIENRC